MLPGLTDELYALLREVLPLVPPAMSGAPEAAALVALGARELTGADLADAAPRDRDPAWYAALYDALDAARLPAEDLGALPVPLVDGRVVTGARGAVILPGGPAEPLGTADSLAAVTWARVVHPAAQHPLLDRAGARRVAAAELLADDALRAEVERVDWDAGPDDSDLALTEAVLAVAARAGAGGPGRPGPVGPSWLGALPVPGDDGALYPADELLAAAAPLRAALGDDHPYGTVDPEFEAHHSAEALRAIGVVWSFPVLREVLPTEPDVTLDGAEDWWEQLPAEPDELVAVRDLDLVEHWDEALTLLADLPGVLDDPDGYTAWWLRTYTPLGRLRPPDEEAFAGLLDPCTHPAAPRLRSALFTGVRSDADAQILVDALADGERSPTAGTVFAAHRAIAGYRPAPPDRVRGLDGALLAADVAAVLDLAHARFTGEALVFGGIDVAVELAETLDLPLASVEAVRILTRGERFVRGAHPGVTLAQALGELPDAPGIEVHAELRVRARGRERRVPFLVSDGVLHVDSERL